MKNTNKITKYMLYFPSNMLYIGVSPLIRAKQTACLMKPIDININNINNNNNSIRS